MTKITWQYIGGFFDGEGCIYFNLFLKNKGKNAHFYAGIYQSENQAKVLYEIQKFLKINKIESHIYIRKNKRNGTNHKGVSLEMGHRIELLNFLKCIEPYLFVKKQKCKEAIKQLQNYSIKKGVHRSFTNYEKELIKSLSEEGKKPKEISKLLNLNLRTIYYYRTKMNELLKAEQKLNR